MTASNFKFLCIAIIVSVLFTLGNTIFDFVNKSRLARAERVNIELQQKYNDTQLKQRIANDQLARLTSELIANRHRLDSLYQRNDQLQQRIAATAATYAAIKKALEKKTNFADSTKTAILNSLPK